MNMHTIASRGIKAVNPMIAATLMRSTGSTANPDGSRTPTFSTSTILVQDQAISATDLRHIDALGIEGIARKVWANGSILGVNRLTGRGGDLLVISGVTYLCTLVSETWDQGNWCSVFLTQQMG
jgi:hypothetical protein